jgi:putative photosynthetic complex assembly protein
MSSHSHDQAVPRGPLIGAVALVLAVLTVVGVGRISGAGVTSATEGVPLLARELIFADRPDGSILVSDADAGSDVAVLAPGSNGFVRGALRALVRDRRREDVGGRSPFHLAAWPDGRLTLEDPSTGRVVGLEAFGPTNMAAFARLLTADGGAR